MCLVFLVCFKTFRKIPILCYLSLTADGLLVAGSLPLAFGMSVYYPIACGYLTFINILPNLIFFNPLASLLIDNQINFGFPTT